jgi:hypothetical protein
MGFLGDLGLCGGAVKKGIFSEVEEGEEERRKTSA